MSDRQISARSTVDTMKASPPSSSHAAIAALYEQTGFLVQRRCMQMLGNAQAAQDVTQWAYMRAWETGLEVRSRGEALSWLYQTVTRRCLTQIRNDTSRARLRDRHGHVLIPSSPSSPEASTVSRDMLHQALQRLTEREAEIALATSIQGDSVARVAERLDVSTKTVSRARRAFEAVMRELMQGSE